MLDPDLASGSALNAIQRISLKETAVHRICEAIERGELKPGESVTELGLARQLGVAQPTIREALLELEFSGFIERVGPRKTRITALTRDAIDDIYVVRSRLELLAVELVIARKEPDLRACREEVARMEAASARGQTWEFWYADLAFHRALWKCSNSTSLQMSLERLVPKLFAFAVIRHADVTAKQQIQLVRTHRELLKALEAGNANAAKRVMETSMEKARLGDDKWAAR